MNFWNAAGAIPSMGLFGLEGMRAVLEYTSMQFMDRSGLAAGDGHPVVVFPCLANDAQATAPLRSMCQKLGYTAYDWGRGTNVGPEGEISAWLDDLAADVAQLTARHDSPVTLIGWSLGGIYARELAKRDVLRVRQVITIGTPFASIGSTNVGWVYEAVNGQRSSFETASLQLAVPPQVPTTSIYSRSDGIVSWEACRHDDTALHTEDIEVEGSHCGLGWNPAVLSIVADRLAQPAKNPVRFAVGPA